MKKPSYTIIRDNTATCRSAQATNRSTQALEGATPDSTEEGLDIQGKGATASAIEDAGLDKEATPKSKKRKTKRTAEEEPEEENPLKL